MLILTDCTSPIWSNGAAGHLISQWGNHNLVSLVQMLPADLWYSCALANAIEIAVSARIPGLRNVKLTVERPWYWDDIWDENDSAVTLSTPVPIVTLEPEALCRWAKMMMGKGETTAATFYLSLQPIDASEYDEEENSENLSPEERWRRFRATASPMAQELAGYLSAAPLSLPVMRLVQRMMMPQSRQAHLAEILRSGLIEHVTMYDFAINSEEVRFEFVKGIRELLLTSILLGDTYTVLEKVSAYVSRQNEQTSNFRALLLDPTYVGEIILDKDSLPFAYVFISVLKRLGGTLAQLAKRVEAAINTSYWIDGRPSYSMDGTPKLTQTYYSQIESIYRSQFYTISPDTSTHTLLVSAGKVYEKISNLNNRIGLTERRKYDHPLIFMIAGWLKAHIQHQLVQQSSQEELAAAITHKIFLHIGAYRYISPIYDPNTNDYTIVDYGPNYWGPYP